MIITTACINGSMMYLKYAAHSAAKLRALVMSFSFISTMKKYTDSKNVVILINNESYQSKDVKTETVGNLRAAL